MFKANTKKESELWDAIERRKLRDAADVEQSDREWILQKQKARQVKKNS